MTAQGSAELAELIKDDPTMGVPQDQHLLETGADVVIRFKGHGSYAGCKGNAIMALARRSPGFSPEDYESVFDFLCRVYDKALEVTNSAVARGRLNFEDCRQELLQMPPKVASEQKTDILRCVISWHHLM